MMHMSETYDLIVAGGTVINPALGQNEQLDVAVQGDKIVAVQPNLPRAGAGEVIDAAGCYVTPGLIDFHVHSYWGVNPYGFNVDPICCVTGVTTTADAGSAGPINFLGFKHLVYEGSRTRMLSFVALAQHGVFSTPGELENIDFADPEGAAKTVLENPDIAVGIKVRLHMTSVGQNGREALRLAIQAGNACNSPVMVHVGNTGISMEEIVETLRPGDIVTHCYTPLAPSIVDEAGNLRKAVLDAHKRGLLFDVGHANKHFDFDLVKGAMDQGLPPDIISTDLHGKLGPGHPIVDLPTTMTKFLALGSSMEDVVAACTINPARAIGWEDRLGVLEVGREADLAVLELCNDEIHLRDSVKKERTWHQRIAPRYTIRAGAVSVSAG